MDAASEETLPETPDTPPQAPAAPIDETGRLLAGTSLALVAIAVLELVGTTTIGLAVDVSRLNFASRQGYAFLTQLEKSPVGLALVVAALAAGIVALRTKPDARTTQLTKIALWAVVVSAAILGIGTVLAVLSRFRVAELTSNQPVDDLTRRVLVVFVIRNFGTAIMAMLIAVGSISNLRSRPASID